MHRTVEEGKNSIVMRNRDCKRRSSRPRSGKQQRVTGGDNKKGNKLRSALRLLEGEMARFFVLALMDSSKCVRKRSTAISSLVKRAEVEGTDGGGEDGNETRLSRRGT